MEQDKALEWIVNGEVGASSRTMFAALLGVPCEEPEFPHNAEDFRRCYLFAQKAKLTRVDLDMICKRFPWWSNIRDIWYQLETLLGYKQYDDIYNLINEPARFGRLMLGAHGMVRMADGTWKLLYERRDT